MTTAWGLDKGVENARGAKGVFASFPHRFSVESRLCNRGPATYSSKGPSKGENPPSESNLNLGGMDTSEPHGFPPKRLEETFLKWWLRLTPEEVCRFALACHFLGVLPQGGFNHYVSLHPDDNAWLLEQQRLRQPVPPLAQFERQEILERDGEQCRVCGTTEGPFEVDHKRPRSRGGDNKPSNLWVLCMRCNCSKSDKTVEEFLAWRKAQNPGTESAA